MPNAMHISHHETTSADTLPSQRQPHQVSRNGNEQLAAASQNNQNSVSELLMTVEEGDAGQQAAGELDLDQMEGQASVGAAATSQHDTPSGSTTSTSLSANATSTTATSTTATSGLGHSLATTMSPPPPPPPQSPQRQLASNAAHQLHLASIHSLHPQLDLRLNNRFMLMPSNDQIRELQTVLRDKATTRGNFKFYADRLIRLVVEEGLNQLPTAEVAVNTPTGNVFKGIRYLKGNCGVSIVRSGESMEQGLRDCCRSIRIGKILIESDENNQARVLYAKFPRDIAERKILLLYPIMSTGLAVIESVKVLLGHGVREDNLLLLNLFSSPRAAKIISSSFPKMSALTSDINPVCPNHFGQRYFGTD